MQVHRLSDIGIIVYVYNIHITWLFFSQAKIEHVWLQQWLWSQKRIYAEAKPEVDVCNLKKTKINVKHSFE